MTEEEAKAAAAAEVQKVKDAAAALAKGDVEDVTHIPLPDGRVFKATKEDLMFLATRGAAEEFNRASGTAASEAATAEKVKADAAAALAAAGGDQSKVEIGELKKQLAELSGKFDNAQASQRINTRRTEIVSTIDSVLSVNPLTKDHADLRKSIQGTILTTLLQNPSLTTQAAIDTTLATYEEFAKKYGEHKKTTKESTRGAPGGSGSSGGEPPKPFTLADMKSGKIRDRVTERFAEARKAGAFN